MITQAELTYGKIGEWRFDKRSYLSGPPPRNLSLPPPGVPESVVCPLIWLHLSRVHYESIDGSELEVTLCFFV